MARSHERFALKFPVFYHRLMEKGGERFCDACGQPIPRMSKLAVKEDGKDLCLACQIRESERKKALRP